MNAKMLMQGRSDHPLNEAGFAQAQEAAERFAGMGVKIDKVYTSPLLRARQTAEKIAPDAEISVDERLIEMDYGPYEGMDLRNPAPEVISFFMDFVNVPAPEGMEPLPAAGHWSHPPAAERTCDTTGSPWSIGAAGLTRPSGSGSTSPDCPNRARWERWRCPPSRSPGWS